MAEIVRPDRPSFDEARAIVAAAAPDPRVMRVPLADALGRITATPITAARDYPAFDASAMDGFAFPANATKGAATNRPTLLPIAGESRAGGAPPVLNDGSACAISTGAMIPQGCDTVIPRERTTIANQTGRPFLRFDFPELAGRNVRRCGEDVRSGEPILPPGMTVSAEMIGALGCFGLTDLPVFVPPRIAIIPTGDELVDGATLSGIVDSNGPMIAAAAMALGLSAARSAPVADCARSIERAFQAVLMSGSAEVIVSTGGVSAGDHDHVSAALRAMGATIHFHGIRMRPGKPMLFATFANGTLFFGLPGNPVAALVSFRFFVVSAVRAMLGRSMEAGEIVEFPASGHPKATVLLKALTLDIGPGLQEIQVLPGQQSHMMRPLLTANCWLAVDEGVLEPPRVRKFALAPSLT